MNNFFGDSNGGLCPFLTIGSIDYTKLVKYVLKKLWADLMFSCVAPISTC